MTQFTLWILGTLFLVAGVIVIPIVHDHYPEQTERWAHTALPWVSNPVQATQIVYVVAGLLALAASFVMARMS